jgi:uncharacterized protein (DUF488 family)
MKIYTIGFTQKKAEEFFGLLRDNGIERLMDERHIPFSLGSGTFANERCCLLCSEALPEKCHRRLVVERLASFWEDVDILHL